MVTRFYEQQAEGVGEYFLDTLFSDIDSLVISGGIHPIHFGKYHRLLSKRFPFAVYYPLKTKQPGSTPCLIVGEIRPGFARS